MALILVVEDETTVQMVLAEILSNEGYLVELAKDGATANERLRQEPYPDLLLLDSVFPGIIQGTDVAKAAYAWGIPVILITGVVPTLESLRSSKHYSRLIPKPFDVGDVLNAVATLTQRPSSA